MRRIVLISAAALFAVGCDRGPDGPRKAVACAAAARLEPTLDATVLPGTTFEIVEEDVGQETGADGTVTTLFLKHGVERARLAGGVDLEVSLGGCEYYANVYTFTFPRAGRPASDTDYWLQKAVEFLSLVEPADKDKVVDLSALQLALRTRAADPAAAGFADNAISGTLPLGAPGNPVQHHYAVRIAEQADKAQVTVQYAVGPL